MALDILYPPGYIHLKPGVSCRKCGSDPSCRIDLDASDSDDEAEDGEPRVVVHRGTIASGELVLKMEIKGISWPQSTVYYALRWKLREL